MIDIHCFNHRVELAAKDAFQNSFFEDINKMLVFLYYLYQKSSKQLQVLKELGMALGENVPKPVKASGTRKITHRLMQWKFYCILVQMSLSKESDEQDLVKAVHRIENSNWTMAKLHKYIESSLDEKTRKPARLFTMKKLVLTSTREDL